MWRGRSRSFNWTCATRVTGCGIRRRRRGSSPRSRSAGSRSRSRAWTSKGGAVLLNGFKRYRCARKLALSTVPYASLGDDEAAGIICVLRTSNHRSLGILEQARFIEDLRTASPHERRGHCRDALAEQGLGEHAPGAPQGDGRAIREKIFSGAFPVYSYMYTAAAVHAHERRRARGGRGLRRGRRRQEAERPGDRAARPRLLPGAGVVPKGGRGGQPRPGARAHEEVPDAPDGTNGFERVLLGDLEIVGKYMQRTHGEEPGSQDPRPGRSARRRISSWRGS